jgi:hypothetical protein
MGYNRIHTLDEARAGVPVRVRQAPRPRACVLEDDPSWLHEGTTMRLRLRGTPTDLFTIGVIAGGLGRSVNTVRRLEADGIIPEAECRTPGRTRVAQQRLYTRETALAIVQAAVDANLIGRRPRRWDAPLLRSK